VALQHDQGSETADPVEILQAMLAGLLHHQGKSGPGTRPDAA
jgi:hypothetical protein